MAKGATTRGPRRRRGSSYVWSDYHGAQWLLGLAIGTALAGGAVRIGHTRDGGALALGIYLGDDYGVEYIRPDENLAEAVREIAMAWGVPIAIWDDEAGTFRAIEPPDAR